MYEARNPKSPSDLLVPYGQQVPFKFSTARNTALVGGWRSGKSVGALGFIETSLNANPGCMGGIIEPDYKMMRDFVNHKFRPAFGQYIVGESKQDGLIFLRGGESVLYLSGHNLDKLEQYEFGWLLADEFGLMGHELVMRANARVNDPAARRPRIGYTGTPKMGWPRETFEGRHDEQRTCLHARTTDNPHLTEDFIEGLRASMPARLVDAYLNGLFISLGGVVYPEFDRERHVIPWQAREFVEMADGSHSRSVFNAATDPSPLASHALWIQRVPKGALMPGGWVTQREVSIVVDEIYPGDRERSVTMRRLCDHVKRRRSRHMGSAWPIGEVVIDPAMRQRGMTAQAVNESALTQMQRYMQIPIAYRLGERISIGIQHVELALDPADGGHPWLFFSSDLLDQPDDDLTPERQRSRSILRAMEGYSYRRSNKGILLDDPDHDDVYSHACDALRYHVRYYYPEDRLALDAWEIN